MEGSQRDRNEIATGSGDRVIGDQVIGDRLGSSGRSQITRSQIADAGRVI
jgi:hypothetical protein